MTEALSKANTSTDTALILRCQKGEASAFAELIARYKRPLFLLALRLTQNEDDAEDLTQEAFLRAFRHVARINPNRGIKNWLHKVLANLCLNHLRDRRRRGPVHSVSSEHQLGAVPVVDPLEERHIDEALATLKPELRMAVTLVWVQGMTHREAGEVMGASEGTISWRIFKAKEQLRPLLEPLRPERRRGT